MGYEPNDVVDLRPSPAETAYVAQPEKKRTYFMSNVVDDKTMRSIQSAVLTDLSNILIQSFGPHGSNTCIKELNAFNTYTKDGHTILSHVQYNGVIEQAIKDDITTITNNIVKTVGDGTTSAVLMSKVLFDLFSHTLDAHPDINASDLIRSMEKIGKMMDERIRESAKEADLQDIYDIAYTASNGNPWVAQLLYSIYDTGGMNVFVDVTPTTAPDTTVKVFDGMSVDSGVMDAVFITDTTKNVSTVDHPQVYFFDDPIDTKELGVLLDAILSKNIMEPIRMKQPKDMVPTVIVAPKISRDMSSLLDTLVSVQAQMPTGNKFPITFVLNRTQRDQINDIATLCGAKSIFKYIDSKVYEEDVAAGRAPTPENIGNWAGTCESVECGTTRTKFVNPILMHNEDGEYSNVYNNLLQFVETELKKQIDDGGNAREIGTLRRRLHALKSNLVEVHVGGMTVADRDSLLHLIEDAVKNCRSAAANGVGWGANVSGLITIYKLWDEIRTGKIDNISEADRHVVFAVKEAYTTLVENLYATRMKMEVAQMEIDATLTHEMPLNLRTEKYDGTVKSSIESDTIILNSVMKIIGIMVTCNQFLTPTSQHNVYVQPKEI